MLRHVVFSVFVFIWLELSVGCVDDRAGHILQKVDADIHLQGRVTVVDAFLHAVCIFSGILRDGGIAIYSDTVAVLAAEQHVYGNIVSFACQIPQRHLDSRNATALTTMMAELSDLLEESLYIARVLSQQSAFQ